MELLSNLIIHQHEASKNMNKKIDDIQLCSIKPNLIINGLETSAKQETESDYMELCMHFFQTILEIAEPILMIMAHCVGQQSKDGIKAMVLRLQNPWDKSLVVWHVKALTGKKNYNGSLYLISKRLPEGHNEVRRQL